MSQSVDFSLPQAPRRSGPRVIPALTLLVAVGCLILLVVQIRVGPGATPSGDGDTDAATNAAARLRDLAETLEKRTLYEQAADVWGEYARVARLDESELGENVYRRGRLLVEAGRCERAVRFLTEVERMSLEAKKKRHAHVMLLDCLSAMDREEARKQALQAFAMPGEEEKGTVLARVGGEEITREELRRELVWQTTAELRLQGSLLGPEELEAKAREMADERLNDPKIVRQILEKLISTELLYREALARNLATGEAGASLERATFRFRRGYLADRLVGDELRQALQAVEPRDLRNHYEAHEDDYFERPAVEFSYLAFQSEEEATAMLETLAAGGAEREALLAKFQKGEGPAVQGEPILGLGRSPEITAHLLALDEGKVGNRPIAHGESWYLFRADKKRPRRQKSYEEAEAEVRADVARIEQQEAVKKLQQRLTEKFEVEIVTENLEGATAQEGDGGGEGEEESGEETKESPQ